MKPILNYLGFGSAPEAPEVSTLSADEVTAQLAEARTEIERRESEHSAQLAAKDQKIEELQSKLEETEKALGDMEENAATAANSHEEQLAELKESLRAEISAEIAKLGVEPLQKKPAEKTDDEIVSQYRKLPAGPERSEFREQNKQVLAAAGAIR